MAIVPAGPWQPMVGDPDDHRPRTQWRLVVDSGEPPVQLAVIDERCAAGDRIPLHRHDVDEVVMVVSGQAEYLLAGVRQGVAPGDVVFIPAGTAHGTVNSGTDVLHVHAVFPARQVRMEMLDRNPAPGTEGDPPMTTVYDFATGEFQVLGPTEG